jgi:cell division septation protein DedD
VAQATNQARCVLLGPFEQQAEASAFATSLDADKFDASIVMKSEQRQSGYWVLADPDSDNEKPLLARLKTAGIEDVWRFTKGDLAGIVSLGLYSRRSRAEGRLKAVQKKGINANIRPRFIEETAYWAQTIQLGPKEKASENLEAMFRQHQKLHYPPPECAEVANNAAIP